MDYNNIKILAVDDESDILEFLSYNLKKEGFSMYTATNGHDAIQLAQKVTPHVVILDVMMPEMDGMEICEKLRQNPLLENTLIVFLTARLEDYSQIAGFEAGADDYITKPVKPKVLITRLKALLKRYGNKAGTSLDTTALKFSDLTIDPEKYMVYLDSEEIILPRKEFKLLLLLTSKPSRVFTREEIFDHLWGTDVFVGDRTIDVYIRKLREKIGEKKIVTVKGVGYKFQS
ncbi:MAG: response regulator transcription factor [Bacteroidales bacterium]|nr:response regulator transcription factor [Bacteroidales bacterium]